MESLFSYIANLHQHHVSTPHEGENVDNWIKVVDEDILIDIESPYEQSRDQNDWKQEFHNNVLFSSDERICDQITMKLQNCKSDGQTNKN